MIWAYGNLNPVSEADTFNIFLKKKILLSSIQGF